MKKLIIGLSTISMFSVVAYGAVNYAAKVNGKIISINDLDQSFKQTKLFVTHKKITKKAVLEDLVTRELGIQKAYKMKLEQDPTVKKKMEDVLYHAMISKDLEGEFKKIKVSEAMVKQYYKGFPEYRTAQILFRTRPIPSKPEAEEAMKIAWKVYNELKNDPTKFPELANKFSQTAVAPIGGDMGYQPAVKLAQPYFMAIHNKPIGFISKPVVSQYGVHVIKVLGVKDVKDINIPMYQKIVYDKKRDAVIEKYNAELRKGASIQMNEKIIQ